jgi:hypothetical protein
MKGFMIKDDGKRIGSNTCAFLSLVSRSKVQHVVGYRGMQETSCVLKLSG